MDWFEQLRAAANHSPQALDFTYHRLKFLRSKGGGSQELDDMDYALNTFFLIVEMRLPYFVHFEEWNGAEKIESTIALFGRLCPFWRVRPGWNGVDVDEYVRRYRGQAGVDAWGPVMIGDDGKIDPEILMGRLNNIKTVGGGPYRTMNAFVNKECAAHVKMFYEHPTIADYSDYMKNGQRYLAWKEINS